MLGQSGVFIQVTVQKRTKKSERQGGSEKSQDDQARRLGESVYILTLPNLQWYLDDESDADERRLGSMYFLFLRII